VQSYIRDDLCPEELLVLHMRDVQLQGHAQLPALRQAWAHLVQDTAEVT